MHQKDVDDANRMFYALSSVDVLAQLDSRERMGLAQQEVQARLAIYGPNVLPEARKKSRLLILLGYFTDFLMLILMVAAAISFFVGDVKDGVVILLIVVANALMGFFQESKADNAIAALKKLSVANAKVVRDGEMQLVEARDLVPGDVLVLETGDKIPADARLLEAVQLKVSESALTGESKPVEKDPTFLASQALAVGDRYNMVYKDTIVVYGRGRAVVTETGMATEIGRVSQLLQTQEKKMTPLNVELDELGKRLTVFAGVVAVLIFLIILGLDASQWKNAFLTSVSMAIAVVPEGIPAVVTTVLAISVARLARKRAIVRKLSAVETLGAASCILTDKTGTLTKNEMEVSDVSLPGRDVHWQDGQFLENGHVLDPQTDPMLCKLIFCAVLCNDASFSEGKILGDPTEACLVAMARQAGFDVDEIRLNHTRIFELPFSSETKQMTVVVRDSEQRVFVFTKGACEVVGGYLKELNPAYRVPTEQMARQGIRSLVYSCKELTGNVPPFENVKALLANHEYLGTIGCKDPLRPEAKAAVALAASAGVRTVMITGDHKLIAQNIAFELGIIQDETQVMDGVALERVSSEELSTLLERVQVFSRVSPEQKLKIVKAAMQNGETVVVTGDGVNDAPAIKTADIGVAMGMSGTDVAKEAADLVLQDDNYSTIVDAIKQGRGIFSNFSKFLSYQIACNLSGVLIVFPLTILFGASPLFPVHILLLNLISETGPCIALGLEKPEKHIMQLKPRKRSERLLTRRRWMKIIFEAFLLAGVSIVAFFLAHDAFRPEIAVSAVLTTAFLSRLWHSLSARSDTHSLFSSSLQTNGGLYWIVLLTFLFLFWALYTSLGNALTKAIPLSKSLFLICFSLSLVPVVVIEVYKMAAKYAPGLKVGER